MLASNSDIMPPRKARAPPNAAANPPVPPPPPPPTSAGGIDFASISVGTRKKTDAERRQLKRARETPAQKEAAPKSVVGHSRGHVEQRTDDRRQRLQRRWTEFRPYYVAYGELDDDDTTTPRPARQLPPVLFDPWLECNTGMEPPTCTPSFGTR